MNYAPIAIFGYKRNLRKLINSLLLNEECKSSDLYIFIDYGGNVDTDFIKSEWFNSKTVIRHKTNMGLSHSLFYGVDYVLSRFDRIVVLEDDLIVSQYFLRFMNDALNRYEHNKDIISICGYTFADNDSNFFLRIADTEGFATWKRGWELLDRNPKRLYEQIKKRKHDFDFYGSFKFTKLLKRKMRNDVDSWGILWYASAFLKNKITYYPKSSICSNSSNDEYATNCSGWDFSTKVYDKPIPVNTILTMESSHMRKMWAKRFRELKYIARKNKIKNLLGI
jgi:GR25 family glycosyltransferase involved in LPS biosynthesis